VLSASQKSVTFEGESSNENKPCIRWESNDNLPVCAIELIGQPVVAIVSFWHTYALVFIVSELGRRQEYLV